MILIIGGACQGKREYALQLSGTDEKTFEENLADGWRDKPQKAMEKPYLISFHGWVRQLTEEGLDPESFVRQILKNIPKIVTMDEIGCGIVPVERTERDYREAVGHAGQMLAEHASQVYRVVCGIPTKIKG